MAQPKLKPLPLSKLHVSKLNMRHACKAPGVTDLVPSIRAKGLHQTLLVRPEDDGFGVVAGRRRFFALSQIAKEDGTDPLVPCAIMAADDDAAAIEASLIENLARLPASDVQQFRAFAALAKQGRTPDEIAEHFGVTLRLVQRILALGSLTPAILRLYEQEEIDGQTIRALTLASKSQQADWLHLWNSETDRAPTGRNCKAWVTGGDTITTDKAIFDLATYDGQIIADLFGEHAVFKDAAEFWQAQSAAIAARVETYLEAGWKDVSVLERGTLFYSYDYTKRARTKGGKVYIDVRFDGTVGFHEGYIPHAEARKLDAADKDGSGPADAWEQVKSIFDVSEEIRPELTEHAA